ISKLPCWAARRSAASDAAPWTGSAVSTSRMTLVSTAVRIANQAKVGVDGCRSGQTTPSPPFRERDICDRLLSHEPALTGLELEHRSRLQPQPLANGLGNGHLA